MALINGISIKRPVGRPTTEQRIAEATCVGIGTDLRRWQKDNNKIASGKSYRGYKVFVDKVLNRTLIIATLTNRAKYLNEVLFGRGSGRPPSTSDIEKWMRIKPVQARSKVSGRFMNRDEAAYLIARQIGGIGTIAPELKETVFNVIVRTNSNSVMTKGSEPYTIEKNNEFMTQTMALLGEHATTDFKIDTKFKVPTIRELL